MSIDDLHQRKPAISKPQVGVYRVKMLYMTQRMHWYSFSLLHRIIRWVLYVRQLTVAVSDCHSGGRGLPLRPRGVLRWQTTAAVF
jgi:hypothetical protein